MISWSVLGYVFFVSWTAGFALGGWLLLPFIFVGLTAFLVVMKMLSGGGIRIAPYKNEDYFIILFLVAFTCSALVNQNESGFNYILAYGFVFGVLYLFVKGVLYDYATTRNIYTVNMYGVFFISLFLNANFILNVAGVADLQALIPRLSETSATYLGVFKRGYAFATEPGIVAFYLNTLGPLALWHMWHMWHGTRMKKPVKWALTGVLFSGWLVTFSASGWAFMATSLVVSLFISGFNRSFDHRMLRRVCLVFFLVLPAMTMLASTPKVQSYFQPIYMKLTLAEDAGTSSSGSRVNRWSRGMDMIFEDPLLGKGPRYFSSRGEPSVLSWYLMVLVEGGFISFFSLLAFLAVVLVRILKFQHPSRFPVLVGFLAGCGHLVVVSTFFEPFLWLLIAIFYVQLAQYQSHQKTHYFQTA